MQCHIAKCKLLPIWQPSPQNTFLFNVTVLAQHLFIKCQLKHSAAYYVLGTSAVLVKSKQFRKQYNSSKSMGTHPKFGINSLPHCSTLF